MLDLPGRVQVLRLEVPRAIAKGPARTGSEQSFHPAGGRLKNINLDERKCTYSAVVDCNAPVWVELLGCKCETVQADIHARSVPNPVSAVRMQE